jgi:hypothetical protein
MKIKELIEKLEKIHDKEGNIQVKTWLSFSKVSVEVGAIYYDREENAVHIGIYG